MKFKADSCGYERVFPNMPRTKLFRDCEMLWNSIPSQWPRKQEFIYGLVREGARAKEYETAMMWLHCGLVHKVSRVNAATPLRAYED
ncbi:MAG: hypothetical protein ACLS7Z_04905 [Christensenellales bacterium]